MGIEPTAPAWEAGVLPLYDARMRRYAGAVWHKNQRGFKHLCHCNGAAGEQFSKRLTAQAGWQRRRERSTTVAFGLHIHGSQAEKRPENRPEDLYLKIVACLIVGLTEHRQHRIRPVKASPLQLCLQIIWQTKQFDLPQLLLQPVGMVVFSVVQQRLQHAAADIILLLLTQRYGLLQQFAD